MEPIEGDEVEITVRLSKTGQAMLDDTATLLGLSREHVLLRGLDLANLVALHMQEPKANIVFRCTTKPNYYLLLEEVGSPGSFQWNRRGAA